MQVEVAHVLVEIGTRCRLHAEAAAAERNFVEVKLEDFFLAQNILDPARKDHLLEFAGHGVFVTEQQDLGKLLRDRRSADRALVRAVFGSVVDNCIGRAGHIDAAMAEEGLVLGREIGADQPLGEIGILQLHPALAGVRMDDLAVDSAHHCGKRGLVIDKAFRIRQVACQPDVERHPDRNAQADENGEDLEQQAVAPLLGEPSRSAAQIAVYTIAEIFER